MKKRNYFVKYLKSIVLILVGTMLFSCENDLAVIESLKVDENTPNESSYNIRTEYTDSGEVIMVMKSPEMNRYGGEEEYIEMPKGVHLVFYDSAQQVKSTLDAEYAINYASTKTMEARNNVVATNAQGQKLFTEELIWDQKEHLIYTEKKVKVVTEGKILFGDGLRADESFENWEISNPIGDIEFEEDTTTNSELK